MLTMRFPVILCDFIVNACILRSFDAHYPVSSGNQDQTQACAVHVEVAHVEEGNAYL